MSQANSLASKGVNVFFIVLNGYQIDQDFKKGLSKNIGFYQLSFSSLWQWGQFFKLIRLLKELKITTIYSTLDHANFISRLSKIFLIKTLVVIRESGMANRKSLKIKFSDMIFNIFASNILAVSSVVAKSLIVYQPFYRNKIIIVENGVLVPKEILRNKKPSPIKLLHVGSMNNHNKNQSFLIDVFSYLLKDNHNLDFQLILVGEGKLRKKLEKQTVDLNIDNQVVFRGRCLPRELDEIYRQSDVFIFASKSEGSPNAVLEAMAYGLPVVSENIPSIESIINDGETGYLIKSGDVSGFSSKIGILAADPEIRHRLGDNARYFVTRNHSLDQTIEKVKNLLCR